MRADSLSRVTLLVALEEEDEGAGEMPESQRVTSRTANRLVRRCTFRSRLADLCPLTSIIKISGFSATQTLSSFLYQNNLRYIIMY